MTLLEHAMKSDKEESNSPDVPDEDELKRLKSEVMEANEE